MQSGLRHYAVPSCPAAVSCVEDHWNSAFLTAIVGLKLTDTHVDSKAGVWWWVDFFFYNFFWQLNTFSGCSLHAGAAGGGGEPSRSQQFIIFLERRPTGHLYCYSLLLFWLNSSNLTVKGFVFFLAPTFLNDVFVRCNNHVDNWKHEAEDPPECIQTGAQPAATSSVCCFKSLFL